MAPWLSETTSVDTLLEKLFPNVEENERKSMNSRLCEKAARDVAGLVLLEKEGDGVKDYLEAAVSGADALVIVKTLKTLPTWPRDVPTSTYVSSRSSPLSSPRSLAHRSTPLLFPGPRPWTSF